ncbi:MAG: hypothetical protein VKL59_09065 [Nostocaceae cyanobacterium]|nr:hypothetical protein [Nostocaceae cyanobacterium]
MIDIFGRYEDCLVTKTERDRYYRMLVLQRLWDSPAGNSTYIYFIGFSCWKGYPNPYPVTVG